MEDKQIQLVKMRPEVCAYSDEGKMHIEIVIPGVDKENIDLRMDEDGFLLKAVRQDRQIEYVESQTFCCSVSPDKANARYENGLLKIEVPFSDPMESAVKVRID